MGIFTATSVTRACSGPSWAEIVTSQLGTSIVEAVGGEDGFYGNLAMWRLGCLRLAHVQLRGATVRGVRKSTVFGCSNQPHVWLAVALAGGFELDYGPYATLMKPGCMAILDPGKTYVSTFNGDNDVLWVELPRTYVEPYLFGSNQIIIDGSHGAGRVAFQSIKAALEEASSLSSHYGKPIAEGVLRLISAAANSVTQQFPTTPTEYRAATRRRIKKYIYENLSDDALSCQTIAEYHGLSVRYVNKLFEEEGTSLMRWTWNQRLERANDALEHPFVQGQRISDIAYAFGFKSVSHFSHAFKNRYGFTPSTARHMAARKYSGNEARENTI